MPEAVEVAGIECILLDIEGTICPISFVKETLFPYALKALPSVLSDRWDDAVLQPYISAFPSEHSSDPEKLIAHVRDLTARDVKAAPLKNLQGYLWEAGYREGAYATPLFEDVAPRLRTWRGDAGKERDVAIYSSGSVKAQKLLFEFVRKHGGKKGGEEAAAGDKRERKGEVADVDATGVARKRTRLSAKKEAEGGKVSNDKSKTEGDDDEKSADANAETEDLTGLVCGWFDTTNAGPKMESSSYEKIAKELKHQPQTVLFLSDNVKEVDAALAAGMKSILVDRPGNAPVSDGDRERLTLVTSLDQINLVNRDAAVAPEDAESSKEAANGAGTSSEVAQ